ncbi:MAG: hypothetical protein J2P41_23985, partial [Blastocatellia bacterium]|nr:hypothetical protein [Blastocatellia bacterium]
MEQTQGTPPIRPHWYGRHKRLLLLGLGFLLLIAFFVIAGVYLILSGKIDRYIANQVREALGEYGLRAEMGKFDISWRNQTAKASDTKIYNQQSGQLIATVDQAELVVRILDPYALRLRRTIAFKQLELSNLNLWLETDAQGRSNLQGLHAAPPSPPGRITFDFSSLSGTLKGGTFHLNDRARKIEGELGGLQANARPLPGGTTAKAQLTGSRGHFLYQGRELTVDRIELALTGGAAGAEIESFTLRSPGVQASANGRIDDWDALRYGINIQAHLALAEVERIFEPGTGLSGTAQFNGRVEGERARYRITGELTSDGFTAAGARVYGAKVAGIGVESDGEQISFRSDQTFVQAVAVQGAKLTRLAAGAIRGGISNGRIRGDMPQLSIGLIEIAQGRISGVALQKATASVAEDRYQLRGNLVVKNGAIGSASLGPLNGELIVDSETIALNKFKANLFG